MVVLRMRDGLQSEIYTPCGPCKWYLDHHRADLGTMTSPLTKGNNCSTCAVWTIWSWTCSRLWRWQWTSREPTPPSSPDSHSHHHPHPNHVDCMENLKFTGIYNFLRAEVDLAHRLSPREGSPSTVCFFTSSASGSSTCHRSCWIISILSFSYLFIATTKKKLTLVQFFVCCPNLAKTMLTLIYIYG